MPYTIIEENVLNKFLDDNKIEGTERDLIIENTLRTNALNSALNDNFYKNINALKDYDVSLYLQFKDYSFKKNVEFFIESNNLVNFKVDNKVIYKDLESISRDQALNFIEEGVLSRVCLEKMEDFFAQIQLRYLNESMEILNTDGDIHETRYIKDFKSIPMLFAFGLGAGLYLDTLYDNLDIKRAIIFEPDCDYFFIALHLYDFVSLFKRIKDKGFYLDFCIGKAKDEMILYVRDYLNNNGHYVADLAGIYIHYNSDIIEETTQELNINYRALTMGLGFFDDSLFALSHSIENVQNKRNFVINQSVLDKSLKDTKIFVVANGPSLENDLDFLRKNQDKALIMACGTALDTLYTNGIKADFFAVTERTFDVCLSFNHLNKDNFLDDVILICSDIVHRNTLKPFKHHMMFLKAGEIFANLLSMVYPKDKENLREIYFMNPLVTNMGLSSMLNLGFRELYLFGVDNGKRNGSKMHASSSFFYNTIGGNDNDSNVHFRLNSEIEGNFGGYVESNELFKSAILSFENCLNYYNNDNLSCINCSDGAKIRGTIAKRSAQLDFDSIDNIDKESLKANLVNSMTMPINLDLSLILDYYIDKKAYKELVDKLIANLAFSANDRLSYIDELSTSYNMVAYNSYFNISLLKGSFDQFMTLIINALYKYTDLDKALLCANKIRELLTYFLEDSVLLVNLLPHYVMEDHRALTNNKVGQDHEHSKALDADLCRCKISHLDKANSIPKFVKRYK